MPTKGEVFEQLKGKFVEFLTEHKIPVPDDLLSIDTETLKAVLKLRIKPYAESLESLKEVYGDLLEDDEDAKQLYNSIDNSVKERALRYIQAMCKLVQTG